jgi:heptosyltransferase-2
MIFARKLARKALAAVTSPRVAGAIGGPLYALAGRRAPKRAALDGLHAILVVRLDEIGDVVMTSPFLRELRRNAPDAWITLVVKPETVSIVEHCPYVNEILTYDWRAAGRAVALRRHLRALSLAADRLWGRHFDLAILPRRDADYYHATYLAYFSGATRRVGYSESATPRKKLLNPGFDSLLTESLSPAGVKHEVEHNLDVIRFLGGNVEHTGLEVWLHPSDRAFAAKFLEEHYVANGAEVFALAPGARLPKKQWPVSRFVEVAQRLHSEYDARLVVVGGPDDRPLAERLRSEVGPSIVNAVGTTLRQTAALVERCRLTVTNDSGPMHLSAAVGSPVVEISWHAQEEDVERLESPERFGPWGVAHVVVRSRHSLPPCRGACESDRPHCILQVTVDQVVEAVRALLRPGAHPQKELKIPAARVTGRGDARRAD